MVTTLSDIINLRFPSHPINFEDLMSLLKNNYFISIVNDKKLRLDFLLISNIDKFGRFQFKRILAEQIYNNLKRENLDYLTIGLLIPINSDKEYYSSRGAFYYPIGEVVFPREYSTKNYIWEIKELLNTSILFYKNFLEEQNPVYQLISLITSEISIEKLSRLLLIAHRISEKYKNNIISSKILYSILRNIYYSIQIFSSNLIDGKHKIHEGVVKKIEKGLDEILNSNYDIISFYHSKDKRIFRPREGSNEIANLIYYLYIGDKINELAIKEGFNLEVTSSIFYGGLTTGLFLTYVLEKVYESHSVNTRFITVSRNEEILNRNLDLRNISKIVKIVPFPLRKLWSSAYPEIMLCDDSIVSGRAMVLSAILIYLLVADRNTANIEKIIKYINNKSYKKILKYLEEKEGIFSSAVTQPDFSIGYYGDEKMIDPEDLTFKPLFTSYGTGGHENHAKKVLRFFGLHYNKSSERISIVKPQNKYLLRLRNSLETIYSKYLV